VTPTEPFNRGADLVCLFAYEFDLRFLSAAAQRRVMQNENPSRCGMRCTLAFVTLLLSLTMTPWLRAQSRPAADLIIRNAKIWTVDKSHPTAQAVAVLGDRIVAVGSDREVEAWRGARTQIIDASGKLLLPGFNDAHVHFVDGGLALDRVQLNDAASAEEFARRIGERVKQTPKGEWVTGGDWDETKWTPRPCLPRT
jgi:hypothetical protein